MEVIARPDGWVRAAKMKTSATVATCANDGTKENLWLQPVPPYLHAQLPSYVFWRWMKWPIG